MRLKTSTRRSGVIRVDTMFRLPIITYHSIDDCGSVISTTPAVFRRQVSALAGAGYQAITLREMVSSIEERSSLPEKPIVLTFDDGFRNFFTEAFPILEEFGYRATVFLVTDFCGRHNDWSGNPASFPRSEILNWTEIRELGAEGIEFGSHTKTHPDLTRISSEALENEIVGSKKELDDNLGVETTSFAYPFGKTNGSVKRLAAATFKSATSTVLGKVTEASDLHELERVDAYYLSNQRIFDLLDTSIFDRYLRVRQCLRNAKSLAKGDH